MKLKDTTQTKSSRYSTRTVYVAKADIEVWQEAVDFCKEYNVALSTLVADALRWYMERLTYGPSEAE